MKWGLISNNLTDLWSDLGVFWYQIRADLDLGPESPFFPLFCVIIFLHTIAGAGRYW